jgi:hypothetical protein
MLTSKIEPLGRDYELFLDNALGADARSRLLAQFAAETRDEAIATNESALGQAPPMRTFVDGSEGGDLSNVRPDGTIAFEFDLISEAVRWIEGELVAHSPLGKTRRYVRSHRMFVDGAEVDDLPNGFAITRVEFIPLVPYARAIEGGESKQAPDGVYRAIAALARSRYGRFAQVQFAWSSVSGVDGVQPSIKLTVK